MKLFKRIVIASCFWDGAPSTSSLTPSNAVHLNIMIMYQYVPYRIQGPLKVFSWLRDSCSTFPRIEKPWRRRDEGPFIRPQNSTMITRRGGGNLCKSYPPTVRNLLKVGAHGTSSGTQVKPGLVMSTINKCFLHLKLS